MNWRWVESPKELRERLLREAHEASLEKQKQQDQRRRKDDEKDDDE